MESKPFTIVVDNVTYNVQLHSDLPRLYDVSNATTYYRIGKTDAGLWVYIEHTPSSDVIPIPEVGAAIDEYLGYDNLTI